jgi:hypothetical protein
MPVQNRLRHARADKLVYCFSNLRLLTAAKSGQYKESVVGWKFGEGGEEMGGEEKSDSEVEPSDNEAGDEEEEDEELGSEEEEEEREEEEEVERGGHMTRRWGVPMVVRVKARAPAIKQQQHHHYQGSAEDS